jgi:hypothetical protein
LPPPTRPHSSRALSAGPSSGIFASPAKRGGRKAERDWDDAWDSSSDHEDNTVGAGPLLGLSLDDKSRSGNRLSTNETVSPLQVSSPGPLEAGLSESGAWELVDAAEVQPVIGNEPEKKGAQAIRVDVHEILYGTS